MIFDCMSLSRNYKQRDDSVHDSGLLFSRMLRKFAEKVIDIIDGEGPFNNRRTLADDL